MVPIYPSRQSFGIVSYMICACSCVRLMNNSPGLLAEATAKDILLTVNGTRRQENEQFTVRARGGGWQFTLMTSSMFMKCQLILSLLSFTSLSEMCST